MLAYRHGFHAGNYSDVLKHLVQIAILQHLKKKPAPFYYHDTHAGAGVYEIAHSYMQKNREYLQGIGRLWNTDPKAPLLLSYLDIVRAVNPAGDLVMYPGSPEIAALLIRADDRIWLGELHGSDYKMLCEHFAKNRRVRCEQVDALSGLKAGLPPSEKRGLVFVDPSYETDRDYRLLHTWIREAYRRFARGIYAIWYPQLDTRTTDQLLRRFVLSGITDILHIQVKVTQENPNARLKGCGMVVINPPYTLAGTMRETLPELLGLLSNDPVDSAYLVETLVAE